MELNNRTTLTWIACLLWLIGCGQEDETTSLPGLQVRELSSPLFSPIGPQELVFEVAEGTTSLQLLFTRMGSDTFFPQKLVAPSGEVYLDVANGVERNGTRPANRSLVLQIPTNPGDEVEAGKWTVSLLADGEAVPLIHLIERGDPVIEKNVELSLRLLSGNEQETGDVPAGLRSVVEEASALLTAGGGPSLTIEDWEWVSPDLSGPFRSVIDAGKLGSNEDALYVAFPPEDRRLGIYVVDEIYRDQGKGPVAAWSGGEPGPVWSPSGERRGVLLAIPDWDDVNTDEFGLNLAHNVAHYLGVHHTTEANGSALYDGDDAEVGSDNLETTPICPDEQDLDEDLFLTWGECNGWDSKNLMFWNPLLTSREVLPEQGEQMLLHPLVR